MREGRAAGPVDPAAEPLENLDAIVSVPGVDVLPIGPSDLSIELGVPTVDADGPANGQIAQRTPLQGNRDSRPMR